jgi:hypothetical protein
MPQPETVDTTQCNNDELYSIVVECPHLTSLDIKYVHSNYIGQVLIETKAFLPCLIELKVNYHQLRTVTEHFTRETTKRNCTKMRGISSSLFWGEYRSISHNLIDFFRIENRIKSIVDLLKDLLVISNYVDAKQEVMVCSTCLSDS